MARTRYVERTRKEIEELFLGMGFHEVKLRGTREMVFERKVKYRYNSGKVVEGLTVRVYTSVSNNGTRKCGADAGRVILVDEKTGRPVWKAKRVHRTIGFTDNIRQRCRDAWKAAGGLARCPDCGGWMVARRKKGEKKDTFWGCIRWPKCRGTKSFTKQNCS